MSKNPRGEIERMNDAFEVGLKSWVGWNELDKAARRDMTRDLMIAEDSREAYNSLPDSEREAKLSVCSAATTLMVQAYAKWSAQMINLQTRAIAMGVVGDVPEKVRVERSTAARAGVQRGSRRENLTKGRVEAPRISSSSPDFQIVEREPVLLYDHILHLASDDHGHQADMEAGRPPPKAPKKRKSVPISGSSDDEGLGLGTGESLEDFGRGKRRETGGAGKSEFRRLLELSKRK